MRRHSRPGRSRYERGSRAAGLFLLAPLLLLLTVPKALEIQLGPWPGMLVRNLEIATIDPIGPAASAGLQTGDRLVTAGGDTTRTMLDWYVAIETRPLPSPLRLLVRRGDTLLDAALLFGAPSGARVVWAASQFLSGLAFLMIGWWVLWRRRDPVARDFFALCLIFAFLLMEVWVPPARVWITVRESLRDLQQLLLPPIFLRFFLAFPATGSLAPDLVRRRRLLLIPAAPLWALSLYAQATRLDPRTSILVAVLQGCALLYLIGCFVAGLVIFARKALRHDRPVQQTKLRLVLLGLLLGLLPFLVGMFLGGVSPGAGQAHIEWLGFSLALVPISFGLAILRYGALDTEFMIRHGLTYAALTLLLVAAYVIIVGLAGHFLTESMRIDTEPLALALVAGCALAALPARRLVQRWIDRAFYPARRESRAAVAELGREMNGLIDTEAAARALVAGLDPLFGASRVSLFLADPRRGDLAETAGRNDGHVVHPVYRVPLTSPLPLALYQLARPVFAEELAEAQLEADPESARVLLEQLGGELLLPLTTGGRPTGLVVLGPKRNGALYTQNDVANLQLLAVHAAAQLENTRLYQESLAQQRLETELAVAQQIQARLVPDAPLERSGLRLLGRMEASHEVGGDYFDYFPLPNDRVGLAIADATGNGIPAALLMTQLRVAFRSEAAGGLTPESVIARLNETACGRETSGNLVSFFYGVYDPADGSLQYCNAGMNPPLLFRAGAPRARELRRGGPVLGATTGRVYRRGTLRLRSGDLLLAFTDGLIDETDAAGEFFDLERLIATVQINLHRSLEGLREQIFATVSAFGGAERGDDRTLMLLQVCPL
jgi:sigma-B regulation protein RsbU (phosphoserine phosphatase)